MGVNIKELVQSSKKVITLPNLTGKKLTIDAFNWIYQFLAIIRDNRGQPLKNIKGETTSHLVGLLNRNIRLLEHNVKPIYVFDGKPNPLKKEELEKRREAKKIARKKYEEAYDSGNDHDIKKYAQATSRLTSQMIEDSKELIYYMGIPIVQAVSDGEAQASYMVQKGDAWACASQDYDSFLFGANRIVRNLSASKERKFKNIKIKNDIEFYKLEHVLEELNITNHQLIGMGILIGFDFFKGIKGIATKSAYNLMIKYKSLETIIKKKNDKYNFNLLTEEMIDQLYSIFENPKTTDNYSLQWRKPNKDKLTEILIEKHNFDEKRVQTSLEKICKTGKRQITLDNIFGK